MEVGLTSVDEDERIGFPIVAGKIHLLEPRGSVAVVLAGAVLVAGRRRTIGREGGDRLGVGVHGDLQKLDGVDEGLHGGLQIGVLSRVVTHGDGRRWWCGGGWWWGVGAGRRGSPGS